MRKGLSIWFVVGCWCVIPIRTAERARLLPRLGPLPPILITEYCGCLRHVERINRPHLFNRKAVISALEEKWLDPIAFRADDEEGAGRKGKGAQGFGIVGASCRNNPETVLLALAERLVCVGNLDEGNNLGGADRRFSDDRGYRAASIAVEYNPIGTEALCGADYRTKILRIVDAIGKDEQ